MKLLKTLLLITIIFIFSGCYFLDYVIPEEYFADDGYKIEDRSSYVWISHPADVECEGMFFHSLQGAENYLKNRGIRIYDSYEKHNAFKTKYSNPYSLIYYVKIHRNVLDLAHRYGWAKRASVVSY